MVGCFDVECGIFDYGLLYELDSGFEFYVLQIMQVDDGCCLLVGWMGVFDGDEMYQFICVQGWIYQMICVCELEWQVGILYQCLLCELVVLCGEVQGWCGQILFFVLMELVFDIVFNSMLGLDFVGVLQFIVNCDGLCLLCCGLQMVEMYYCYWCGEVCCLWIFIDCFSVEIFINDGEGVMSSCFFLGYLGQFIFSGVMLVVFCCWLLWLCMVE